MSEADKLFEQLFYEKKETIDYIEYTNTIYNLRIRNVKFLKKTRTLNCYDDINMKLLKAINAKVKELRMGGITIGSYY